MTQFLTKLTSIVILLLIHFKDVNAGTALNTFGPAIANTTRYWDCCKPSCSWNAHGDFKDSKPAQSCDINNNPQMDYQETTGCNGGNSFLCANNSPWAVNDTFSYGFVGAHMIDNVEADWCCGCYELKFTTGPIAGKTMVVQAQNTGYDQPTSNVFNFAIPGGNTSYAGACARQYKTTNETFGITNVGLKTEDQCANLPASLQAGCRWRFDWFKDAIDPKVQYTRVSCPKALVDITGCVRTDEDTFKAAATKDVVANATKNATSDALAAPGVGSFSTVIVWGITALFGSWVLFI